MPATHVKNEITAENELNRCDLIQKQLTDEYAQEMPSRLNRMARLIPMAAVGSTEALQSIMHDAHRIRGTAGIFGLPAIGDAMAEIENLLMNLGNEHLGFQDSGAWLMIDKALWSANNAVGDEQRTTFGATK
jgi:chemotaxis protein histidine kinase CheA